MPQFTKFPKIYRLGHADTDGLFDADKIVAMVKLDGSNASIWRDERGIQIGSRNCHLEPSDSFRGFRDWVNFRSDILHRFFDASPNVIIYGEWLVKHQINYPPEMYHDFYVFDVRAGGMSLMCASEYDFWYWRDHLETLYPELNRVEFAGMVSTEQEALELAADPRFAHHEGVVLTSLGGHTSESSRAKIVREEFKEAKATKVKPAPGQVELAMAQKFVTPARIEKMKLGVAERRGEPFQMSHIGEVLGRTHDDILTEEITTISKAARKADGVFDFRKFKSLVDDQVKPYLLNGA